MTKEEFLNQELEKAKAKAILEWNRKEDALRTEKEGREFMEWLNKTVEKYSEDEMKIKRDFLTRERSVYNAVRPFIVHLLRKNVRMGKAASAIHVDDIEKAKKIVTGVMQILKGDLNLIKIMEQK